MIGSDQPTRQYRALGNLVHILFCPNYRDDYVFIDEEQVTDGHVHNFNKYDFKYVSPVGTEYAYDSTMHYGPYSFNKDPKIPTIYPRIDFFLNVIGQRKGSAFFMLEIGKQLIWCIILCTLILYDA